MLFILYVNIIFISKVQRKCYFFKFWTLETIANHKNIDIRLYLENTPIFVFISQKLPHKYKYNYLYMYLCGIFNTISTDINIYTCTNLVQMHR